MERKYPINYLPVAEQDLSEIMDYIMVDAPAAALNLLNQFDESISILALFPHSGVIPNDARLQSLHYRMLIVHSYFVFYVFNNETIEIRRTHFPHE